MKSLINGIGGGFGRVFGRIIAYFVLALILYFLLKYFNIDIKDIVNRKIGGLIL